MDGRSIPDPGLSPDKQGQLSGGQSSLSRLGAAPVHKLESVSRRLLKINLRTLALALSMMLLGVIATVTASLRASVIEANQIKAQSLADYISPALVFDDHTAVAGYLDSLSSSRSIRSARVFRAESSVVYAAYDAPDTAARFTSNLQDLVRMSPITLSALISDRGRSIGRLEIRIGFDQVLAEASMLAATVATIAVLVFVMVVPSLGRLNFSIVHPIETLSTQIRSASSAGKVVDKVKGSNILEVNELATGFNELMARIAEREGKIIRLANFDSLTGLRNRRGFLQQLASDIEVARRTSTSLMLLYIDVDGFKNVNDSLGHEYGDAVLIEVARRIGRELRLADSVSRMTTVSCEAATARLGGDEFTALLPYVDSDSAAPGPAERICHALREPITVQGHVIRVSCSIGVAAFPSDGNSADSLLQHADSAMYHAKDSGRDQVRYYDDKLTSKARRRLSLISCMRDAVESGLFDIEYQPIISTSDGSVSGVEALLRWTLRDGSRVSPNEFVPLAEATGMIIPLGRWVMAQACRQIVELRSAINTPIKLAVNASPAQLQERKFVADVRTALEFSGLPASALTIEITEAVLIRGVASAMESLEKLRAMGVTIALDDFGTGYSSLSYLKTLPVTCLKIDRSFISDLPDQTEDLAIVKAIVAMSHELGMSVTAEGVESEEQLQLLTRLGCKHVQGFHFSPSLRLSALAKFIQNAGAT